MKDEEAYELGRRAVYHATHRDSASGGIIRGMSGFYSHSFSLLVNIIVFFFLVYHIKETGWVKISEQDCTELHYQYQAQK